MSASGWLHPQWLAPALGCVAAVTAVVLGGALLARRRMRRLLGASTASRMPPPWSDAVLLAALAALALAALGPLVGERTVWVEASGVDTVVLVDVSRSMEARDVPPSRLARAHALAERILSGLGPGDRAALAAFAGRGVLLTPLTPDHAALRDMLPALDPELMAEHGSWLGAGVRAALGAFPEGGDRPRVVVVLSDGEAPALAGDTGAAEARRAGVRIVGVALGTEEGSFVPDSGVPLRDRRGRVVISRRDARRLGELASATDGVLFEADRFGEVPAGALVAAVRRDAGRAPGERIARRVPAARGAWLAALAFALLAAEAVRGHRGGRRRAARTRRMPGASGVPAARAAAVAAIVLWALPAAPGRAQDELPPELRPPRASAPRIPAPELLLRSGIVRARRGALEDAARELRAAALTARDDRLAALAYFDLGVVELERGRLERARDAFLDALALAPDDDQARFNLEWTLRALAEQGRPREHERSKDDDARADPEANDPGATPDTPMPLAQEDARAGERGRPREAQAEARLPTLDADEAQRWLDSVQDDPARGLRRAARSGESPGHIRGPAW